MEINGTVAKIKACPLGGAAARRSLARYSVHCELKATARLILMFVKLPSKASYHVSQKTVE